MIANIFYKKYLLKAEEKTYGIHFLCEKCSKKFELPKSKFPFQTELKEVGSPDKFSRHMEKLFDLDLQISIDGCKHIKNYFPHEFI